MSDNVCPNCGCKCEVGSYETMRTKLYVAVCTACGMSGPIRGGYWEAKKALCHPQHMMEGKVMVSVEDLRRIVTWFYGDARTVPRADMDETLDKFKAAIDAASKE